MSTIEIPTSLFEDGWLTSIEHIVSSGKEGTVYCCGASSRIDADFVAVKVYRPRDTRSFKNDSMYVQGRALNVSLNGPGGIPKAAGAPDQRLARAIKKRSKTGKRASEGSWTHHEFATLTALHRIGARVPEPFTSTGNAIVMEYLGAPDAPAPKLKDVNLSPADARTVFRDLMDEIALWLSWERIHGDLSPFNILWWNQAITVIDVPQAINPYDNPLAFSLLERDIANVCAHFRNLPAARDPGQIARTMWQQIVQQPAF